MLGMHFNDCRQIGFEAAFDNCILNVSSFYQMKLKQSSFQDFTLHEVDLVEADLTGLVLDNCDLAGAVFENTVLEKADLRTAFNYSIDPSINRLKKAKFSVAGIHGLLYKLDIEIH